MSDNEKVAKYEVNVRSTASHSVRELQYCAVLVFQSGACRKCRSDTATHVVLHSGDGCHQFLCLN
eukprot:scaffold106_cov123-Cylindrotheca_fusiformis.AAC.2